MKTASPRESLVWPYRISANVPGPFILMLLKKMFFAKIENYESYLIFSYTEEISNIIIAMQCRNHCKLYYRVYFVLRF